MTPSFLHARVTGLFYLEMKHKLITVDWIVKCFLTMFRDLVIDPWCNSN